MAPSHLCLISIGNIQTPMSIKMKTIQNYLWSNIYILELYLEVKMNSLPDIHREPLIKHSCLSAACIDNKAIWFPSSAEQFLRDCVPSPKLCVSESPSKAALEKDQEARRSRLHLEKRELVLRKGKWFVQGYKTRWYWTKISLNTQIVSSKSQDLLGEIWQGHLHTGGQERLKEETPPDW